METTPLHRRSRFMALAGAFSIGLAGLVLGLSGGPLDPPAGPVAPTAKTLKEVEPRTAINATNTPGDAAAVFRITQPGSYYLTGNFSGEAGKNGIVVLVSAVTIDLCGFSVTGSPAAGSGVVLSNLNQGGVTVRNGTVDGWPGAGVDLVGNLATGCGVADVTTRGCGTGISISNSGSVTRCTVVTSTGTGINAGAGCTVTGCVSGQNAGIGIATSSGCTINACISSQNSLDGFLLGSGTTMNGCTSYLNVEDGVQTNNGCTVTGCTIYANSLDGIRVATGCVVSNNTFMNNGFGVGSGANIHLIGNANRIDGNNCVGADRGIDVDTASNVIVRNTCRANAVNWDVANNNVLGPVLDRTSPAIAGFTGNSNAGSTGTTDPNANFSY